MSRLIKFKNFEEAANAIIDDSVAKVPVRPIRVDTSETSRPAVGNPYKPGTYRFRSREEAAEFDRKQYIQQAVNKKPGC